MSLQGSLSIERMGQLVPVSRRSFYRSLKEQRPAEEETEVRSVIQQIALEHRRRYGYRRIDNASCESFIKTLKREEIYTNKYDDLEHLRTDIEEFMEEYCTLRWAIAPRRNSSERSKTKPKIEAQRSRLL